MEIILLFIAAVLVHFVWALFKYKQSGGYEMQAINQTLILSKLSNETTCSICNNKFDFSTSMAVHLTTYYGQSKSNLPFTPYCIDHGKEMFLTCCSTNIKVTPEIASEIQANATKWAYQFYQNEPLSKPIRGVLNTF